MKKKFTYQELREMVYYNGMDNIPMRVAMNLLEYYWLSLWRNVLKTLRII